LVYRAPDNVWGDVTQSIIFHQVRKYLLRLDERKKHVKSWRPSILLLADSKYSALIDFCNNLKKGGLYIIGVVEQGQFGNFDLTTKLRESWIEFIDDNELKAFPQITVAPNVRNGLENIILLSGLGALQANTVCLPLIRTTKKKLNIKGNKLNVNEKESNLNSEEEEISVEPSESIRIDVDDDLDLSGCRSIRSLVPQSPASMDSNEYTQLCRNILKFNKNIVITANFRAFDSALIVSSQIQQAFVEDMKNKQNQNEPSLELEEMSLSKKNLNEQTPKKDSNENKEEKQDEKQPHHHKKTESMDFLDKTIHHDFIQNVTVPKSREDAQWIDVWLFATDYTLNEANLSNNYKDDTFPMLLMQLAHILLQNKIWTKRAKAKLRVLLMVNNKWDQYDKKRFDKLLKKLRLNDVDNWITVKEPENYTKPKWNDIINGNKKSKDFKKYYNSLNNTIKSLSSESYFTFMKLPQLPPVLDNDNEMNAKLNKMYYQSMYILLRGLPPTALVQTGETKPVISTDL